MGPGSVATLFVAMHFRMGIGRDSEVRDLIPEGK
jgi:5-carboxymethyl-2-hydroxymuconate isomerase